MNEKESCRLYTIGYQERKLPEFINMLKENGIKHLLDVRDSTDSNYKSEFSEDNLRYVLEYAGIAYSSDKKLGVPKKIRDPYNSGSMLIPEFERFYRERMSKIDTNKLAKTIKKSGKTALMCYERKAIGNEKKVKGKVKFKINCHRSILADVLKETGEFNEIIHL